MLLRIVFASAALIALLAPAQVKASCAPIESCYCAFVASDDAATVVGEVTGVDGEAVDLLVEGEPLVDPGGAVPDGAQLVSLRCRSSLFCSELTVGTRGVFLIVVDAHEISRVGRLEADRVVCDDFDQFDGLDRDQLSGVLLAADCYAALGTLLEQMGYEPPECKDVFSSCGCAGAGGAGRGGLGLLVGAGLGLGRAIRRRARRSPSAR